MQMQVWRERSNDHWVVIGFYQGRVHQAVLITGGAEEADWYLRNGIGNENDPDLAEMVDATQDEFDWICNA